MPSPTLAPTPLKPRKARPKPVPRLTFPRFLRYGVWWGVCLVYGPCAVVLGGLWGGVMGIGRGVSVAIAGMRSDLQRWWEMAEK
jgi:hypothetical protein